MHEANLRRTPHLTQHWKFSTQTGLLWAHKRRCIVHDLECDTRAICKRRRSVDSDDGEREREIRSPLGAHVRFPLLIGV